MIPLFKALRGFFPLRVGKVAAAAAAAKAGLHRGLEEKKTDNFESAVYW